MIQQLGCAESFERCKAKCYRFFTLCRTTTIRWRTAHYLNDEKMFKNLGAGIGAASKKFAYFCRC
jgi:hypothetical protein